MTTCFQHLINLHRVCEFQTKEGARVGKASNSELRRWFAAKSVSVNFETVAADDELPPLIIELTLFPKNDAKRVTLVRENVTFIKVSQDA